MNQKNTLMFASGLLFNICKSWFTIEKKSLHVKCDLPQGRNASASGRGRRVGGSPAGYHLSVTLGCFPSRQRGCLQPGLKQQQSIKMYVAW